MSNLRRHFSTEQKTAIQNRHLLDKVPISDLCDEYGIKPNHVYNWQRILFEHAEVAFQESGSRGGGKRSDQDEKIARLEAKLQQKNDVIA